MGINKILATQPEYLTWTSGLTPLSLLNQMAWGLGYFGMPHILVRFMAVKSVREIALARRICIGWMALSLLGAVLVGIVGAIHFCDCPLKNNETVFMELSRLTFSPWIMGIILAAILSSSMCAIDSQMLAASSALTEDLYRALFRRKAGQRELVWIGRITVLFIAGAAIYIARIPSQSIMSLVAFAWAGLGSTFGAAMVLSLYWKRTTRNGIVIGMLLGCFTTILWRWLGYDHMLYELVPGTIMSYLGIVFGSLLDKKPRKEITDEYENFVHLFKKS
jgi:sodium/proline symporter